MIENDPKYSKFVNPYQIAFDKDYPAFKLTPNGTVNAYKYMFVRDPYGRLLSFYVDKLMASNPYYWKAVGIHAVKVRPGTSTGTKCGHDVTFQEFIKYAILTLSSGKDVDPHWVEMERNCRTCDIRYDYIGKMETFAQNSFEILDKLGLHNISDFLKKDGGVAQDEDAILDSVVQPYTFYSKYSQCLTFGEAIQRAWLKLQIRGMIGPEGPPLHLGYTNSSWKQFFSIAIASRQACPKAVRKQLKTDLQRKYWAQVDLKDLMELKRLYAKDFLLFDYDDHPENVFQGRTLNDTIITGNNTSL